jgi:carbamoyl-phosphate synthase large subunit
MGVIPPQRLKDETCERIEKMALALADRMGVIGILNLQLAVKMIKSF